MAVLQIGSIGSSDPVADGLADRTEAECGNYLHAKAAGKPESLQTIYLNRCSKAYGAAFDHGGGGIIGPFAKQALKLNADGTRRKLGKATPAVAPVLSPSAATTAAPPVGGGASSGAIAGIPTWAIAAGVVVALAGGAVALQKLRR